MVWALMGAAVIGLSLGLFGSGGAILTVPILVFLLGHEEKAAIAESLAIVGVIALSGTIRAAAQRRVEGRTAALLAGPGVVGAYFGAWLSKWLAGEVQLLALAALMLIAAYLMFRPRPEPSRGPPAPPAFALSITLLQGLGLGLVTGLVGVGGGFLIVPVLVLLRRLPMNRAVGTSLAVIALNCAAGLAKYATMSEAHAPPINWSIVGVFSLVGAFGGLAGNLLSGRLPQRTAERAFAVFLVLMAAYIAYRQAPGLLDGPSQESTPPGNLPPTP